MSAVNKLKSIDLGEITPEELAEASKYQIVINWSDEDQIFIAEVPELPGVMTHGKTLGEAAEMAAESAALWLSAARYMDHPIPEPAALVKSA